MAKLNLKMIYACFWLLGTWMTLGAALSDFESYSNKCALIKCPECPKDSSFDSSEEVIADIDLQPVAGIHVISKRDLQASYSDLEQQCCGTNQCSCNKCPERPNCPQDQFLIELSPGNGQPGSCCASYTCSLEPECVADVGITYWRDECSKCNSCSRPPCTDVCDQAEHQAPNNCLSYDNQIKLNGSIWTEANGCALCSCVHGQKSCVISVCKNLECKNPKQLPGECCAICPESLPELPALVDESSTAAATTVAIKVTTESVGLELTSESISNSTDSPVQAEGGLNKPTTEQPVIVADLTRTSTTPASSSTNEVLEESIETTEQPKLAENRNTTLAIDGLDEQPTKQQPEIPIEIPIEIPVEIPKEIRIEIPNTSEQFEVSTELTQLEDSSLDIDGSLAQFSSSTSAPTAPKVDTTTAENEAATDVQQLEDTTATSMDDTEFMISSSSSTENPDIYASTSLEPLTPESTSWHHDPNVNDTQYRFANESHNDALHRSLFYNPWIIFSTGSAALLIVTIIGIFYCAKRKSFYSSVPYSDENLSETTNASDLILNIDQPYQHNVIQKQMKETVE